MIGRTPWGQRFFDSGWIPRSDWTNVHLGTGAAKNVDADCEHGLNLPLAFLDVELFLSEDGSDAGTLLHLLDARDSASPANNTTGIRVDQASSDSLLLQTGAQGIASLDAAGAAFTVDTENWFYRIIVTEKIRPELAS